MKRQFLWWMLASMLLPGCGSVDRIEKGALVGYGSDQGQPGYDSLSIDFERRPGKPVPLFCVRLSPQAPPMRSDALTEAQVARYLPKFQIPGYWPETWKQRARQQQAYEGNGYYLAFQQGVLKRLSLGVRQSDPTQPVTRPVTPARIGPPSCEPLYALPITSAQFGEIFGEPDREQRVNEVYY